MVKGGPFKCRINAEGAEGREERKAREELVKFELVNH